MAMTSLQQLRSVLQAEQHISAQLLEILMDERNSLIKSDAELINAMAVKKQPLVMQLEQLGRHREAILQSEGFSGDKEGLEAFIANQTNEDALTLSSVLQMLRDTAKACREHNQINGGIVNVNRQYLQRAINIFRGRDVNANSYGPGGEYTSQVVRQPLLGRV